MSVWTNLIHWGLAQAKSESQQLGMKATQDLGHQIQAVINEHAKDMAPALAPAVQMLVQGLVAGVMTKAG